jgi:hypothetical protein
MSDKFSEDCRCPKWPACNACLRNEIKNIKIKACQIISKEQQCELRCGSDCPFNLGEVK